MASKAPWVAAQDSWSEDGIAYAYALVPPTALIKPAPTSDLHTACLHSSISRCCRGPCHPLPGDLLFLDTLWSTGRPARAFWPLRFLFDCRAVVSVINLVGSLLVPMYPTVFLVHSEVMEVERPGEPPICLKPRVLRFRDRLFSTGPVTSALSI